MPPKNDPLAGWRKENLAAPKRPQGQAQQAPATVYDDDPPRGRKLTRSPSRGTQPKGKDWPSSTKAQRGSPSRGAPPNPKEWPKSTRGDSPSRGPPPQRKVYPPSTNPSPDRGGSPSRRGPRPKGKVYDSSPSPERGGQSTAEQRSAPSRRGPPPKAKKYDSSSSPGRSSSRSRSPSPLPSPPPVAAKKPAKILTDEERAACDGDTRWPPPNGDYPKPLHHIYQDGAKKRAIYYNLIYQNQADEVIGWYAAVNERCIDAVSKIPADELPQMTVMHALNSKRLRVLSEGKRGKVWLLDEGSAGVWVKMQEMQQERGAVRLLTGYEKFVVFGTGLKNFYGDVLLVSWSVPEEEVKMPS